MYAKVCIINHLLNSAHPAAQPNGFLSDINPNPEEVLLNAMIRTGFKEVRRRAPWPAKVREKNATASPQDQDAVPAPSGSRLVAPPETVRFQGMRMGYFCIDKNNKGDQTVLSQIVTLKGDLGK